jgi:D-alanyl-D-alanine carboxypeptidase
MKVPHSPSTQGDLGIPHDYASKRGLTLQNEATDLVSIGVNSEGREISLTPEAAAAWKRMKDSAAADGIALEGYSGFRSVERQTEIIRRKLASGEKIESILAVNAAPGFSEHHTGRAVDIGVPSVAPLTEDFAETTAFIWLSKHAPSFGFRLSYPKGNSHGISYEPWHWLYQSQD